MANNVFGYRALLRIMTIYSTVDLIWIALLHYMYPLLSVCVYEKVNIKYN